MKKILFSMSIGACVVLGALASGESVFGACGTDTAGVELRFQIVS